MYSTPMFGALAALAAVSNGLSFCVDALTATDVFEPASHSVDFNVGNPQAVYEQGGSDAASCSLTWNGTDVPTCYSKCTGGSATYYARITGGTYDSASSFSLDIWEAYVYELANHNNATVSITTASNMTSYGCTTDAACEKCQTQSGSGFLQTEDMYYGGGDPTGETC